MNRMQKFLFLLFLFTMTWSAQSVKAAPYEGYNYNFQGDYAPAPVPYLPVAQWSGEQLDIGPFNAPEDIFITDDGSIYVLDTGNQRIVALDRNFKVVRVIDSFQIGDKIEAFSKPSGIFVTSNGRIYVADTGNQRIVELTIEGKFIREIGPPQNVVLPNNFRYVPIKLVVDTAGRIYVVGEGNFQGILEFDSDGKFSGFIGVNKVTFNWSDLIWKRLMTKEQRSKMLLFIPVEFNNIAIDRNDFIFATTSSSAHDSIKRLNPSGNDVLRRESQYPPNGDVKVGDKGTFSGPSSIVSVTADSNGMYSILDIKRGRIFTYDREGDLLYQFGQMGERVGNFKSPTEIVMLDDRIVVLDKGLNHLVVFEPTRYGMTIRDAVINSDLGEEKKASEAWSDALKLNSNLEIAYLGKGKSELRQGNYLEAMKDFQLGMNSKYYSKAFERYRKDFMWKHFGMIISILLIALLLLILIRKLVKRSQGEPGGVGLAWYTMFHPFNGFWELKYEKKGKVWFSLLLLLLLSITYILKRQYTGFIFNPNVATQEINAFVEIEYVVLPFFLWCIANWSLTTLMDGEGKFKEIVVATSYAILPILIVQIPLILLSNIITTQEASFYYFIESISFFWCAVLLFVGMMTIHQYSIIKTIVTMLLTLVVIGIFMFLALLFFSLVQQMLSFINILYNELRFRIGEG